MSSPNRIGALALLALLALAPTLFAKLPERARPEPSPWCASGAARVGDRIVCRDEPSSSLSALEGLVLGTKLDLNQVEALDLEVVPGIGPALATAIVAERAAKGRFTSVADVVRVKGIGPARAEQLARYVAVKDRAPSVRTVPDPAPPRSAKLAR